ncbi:MAG TPA: PorP/SprF family type IX secretion system membrane protein [Bacteroidia bacterium]|jgi:type IX secretion system PorP/SprF family membrane protein
MDPKITGRKRMRKWKLALAGLLFCAVAGAQDFHLTQYEAAPLNLNPSMTGMFDGYYRIHAHYRSQWAALINNPFQTMEIGYDMPLKKFSVGGQIMDYTAGNGNYNVFSFEASGAYDIKLDKNDRHHIAVGLQAGIIQKSINFAKLSWGNQYTYSNGGGFDQSMNSGEVYGGQSLIIPDVNAGFTYYYAKEESRVNPFLGFSASHLTHPTETFYSTNNKLPLKYILHFGTKVNINETIQLLPQFFFMRQTLGKTDLSSNDKEMTMSLLMHYYLRQSDAFIIFGPTYRLSGPLSKKNANIEQMEKDAAAIQLGLKYGRYTYRVSYDINTSSLNPYSNSRGGIEFSVTYIGRKHTPNPVLNCPRL